MKNFLLSSYMKHFLLHNVNKRIEILYGIIWYEMTLTDKKKYQDKFFFYKTKLGSSLFKNKIKYLSQLLYFFYFQFNEGTSVFAQSFASYYP